MDVHGGVCGGVWRGAQRCMEGCVEVCGGVHGGGWRGVQRCAEVCGGLHGGAQRCVEVRGGARRCAEGCRGVCGGVSLQLIRLCGEVSLQLFRLCGGVSLQILGGISLHLNHLIALGMTIYDWPFGTLPFRLFGSNLDTRDLETYPRSYSGHF